MNKIYLVKGTDSDGYIEDWEWNVKAFADKEKAEEFAKVAWNEAKRLIEYRKLHPEVNSYEIKSKYDENFQPHSRHLDYVVEDIEFEE